MYGVIYKAVNKINGKFYIGQTVNLDKRIKAHKNDSKRRHNRFYSAIKSHGFSNFEFIVIDQAETKAELNRKEIEWIKLLKPEYNMTKGGDGGDVISNHPNREEIVKSISQRVKNKKITSWKTNLIRKHGYDKTQKIIQERVFNIQEIKKRKFLDKWEDIIKDALDRTGSARGAANYLNISRSVIKSYFKYTNDNFKPDFETIVRYNIESGKPHKNSKPVLQISIENGEIIREFPSASEAERIVGKNKRIIHSAANPNGTMKQAYGFYWKYKEN